MSEKNLSGLDRFTIHARLLPVLVMLFPVWLAVTGLVSSKEIIAGLTTGSVTGLALMALFSQLGRDAGKKKEPGLYERWNGMPSIRVLGYRTTWLNEETLKSHRRKLAVLLGKPLPSEDEERSDPQKAEKIYAACSDLLREKTRDKERFPLVTEELINYNFRRNLWGIKPYGIVSSVIAVVLPYTAGLTDGLSGLSMSKPGIFVSIIGFIFLAIWLFKITPAWVEQAANAYAERLVSSCENIQMEEMLL